MVRTEGDRQGTSQCTSGRVCARLVGADGGEGTRFTSTELRWAHSGSIKSRVALVDKFFKKRYFDFVVIVF